MPRQNHIYSLETLFKIAYDLKRRGKKIAFTHGAFDLFHIGHLDLLQRSAAVSDYLIVGVECNANIAHYKTSSRPIIDEHDRVEIINSLNCIDATFINSYQMQSESYIYLYKHLQADFVTVGPNFGLPEKLEADAKYTGTQVMTLGEKRLSRTSGIVDKIVQSVGS